jgi:hypothetical protein
VARDLTAVLCPLKQRPLDEVRRMVLDRGLGDVLVRVTPLEAVGLVQVEVCDARRGLPCEDPELVARLSSGGHAAYVHVNHGAKQALVHPFVDGVAEDGWAGAPGDEFEARLRTALGAGLEAVTAADDGTRVGIGVAASRTVALVRGVTLVVPPGTPTGLGSFAFHDRGAGLRAETERLAFFAFDDASLERHFSSTPAHELAAELSAAPASQLGPLEGARAGVLAALAALPGDAAARADPDAAVRALELSALGEARVFSGGERVSYWDGRVLPMFSLHAGEPVFDRAEVEDLDESDSVLEAMVDVLPWAAPPLGEGSILSSIADDELAPLAPWATPTPSPSDDGEYRGSIFRLRPERLLAQLRALDGNKLNAMIDRFEHAWYRAARPGQPEGDAFEQWRRALAEEGAADVDRFLTDWTELRIVLELAAANRLAVGLLFYEGA